MWSLRAQRSLNFLLVMLSSSVESGRKLNVKCQMSDVIKKPPLSRGGLEGSFSHHTSYILHHPSLPQRQFSLAEAVVGDDPVLLDFPVIHDVEAVGMLHQAPARQEVHGDSCAAILPHLWLEGSQPVDGESVSLFQAYILNEVGDVGQCVAHEFAVDAYALVGHRIVHNLLVAVQPFRHNQPYALLAAFVHVDESLEGQHRPTSSSPACA